MPKTQSRFSLFLSIVLGILGMGTPLGGHAAESVVTLHGPNVEVTTSGPVAEICADRLVLLNGSSYTGIWCGSSFPQFSMPLIPTANGWALILLSVILVTIGFVALRRKKITGSF